MSGLHFRVSQGKSNYRTLPEITEAVRMAMKEAADSEIGAHSTTRVVHSNHCGDGKATILSVSGNLIRNRVRELIASLRLEVEVVDDIYADVA